MESGRGPGGVRERDADRRPAVQAQGKDWKPASLVRPHGVLSQKVRPKLFGWTIVFYRSFF